jgi:hypothetical protein
MESVNRLLPTPRATEALHSFHTPNWLCNRPDSYKRFAARPPAPLPRFRRRKVLQSPLTLFAIHGPLRLGPIPKTTASLANFQLHAQFH